MVKAYRDTWTLGVHSYLAYLRDRLYAAKELLADSGSIFVQISDENLHRVRMIMDEVFGQQNFCSVIAFWKHKLCDFISYSNYLRLYPLVCKKYGTNSLRSHQLFTMKETIRYRVQEEVSKFAFLLNGGMKSVTSCCKAELDEAKLFRPSPTTSQSGSDATRLPMEFEGHTFIPGPGGWKTNSSGFAQLASSNRLMSRDKSISYVAI